MSKSMLTPRQCSSSPANQTPTAVALVKVQAVIVFTEFKGAFLSVAGPAEHLALGEFFLPARFSPVP